eukprot:7298476-Pyramimonas_sp.AAC.2
MGRVCKGNIPQIMPPPCYRFPRVLFAGGAPSVFPLPLGDWLPRRAYSSSPCAIGSCAFACHGCPRQFPVTG